MLVRLLLGLAGARGREGMVGISLGLVDLPLLFDTLDQSGERRKIFPVNLSRCFVP